MVGSSLEIMLWNSWAVSVSASVGDAEWKFLTKVFMANSRSVYYRVGIVSDTRTAKQMSLIDKNHRSGLSKHIKPFGENKVV